MQVQKVNWTKDGQAHNGLAFFDGRDIFIENNVHSRVMVISADVCALQLNPFGKQSTIPRTRKDNP